MHSFKKKKKTHPSQNGLKHRPTHKNFSIIFSVSYGSLCWPIKEKTLCTHNTRIREPFLTAFWWETGIKNRHWKHLNKKLSSISNWSQILHWYILQGQTGGEKKAKSFSIYLKQHGHKEMIDKGTIIILQFSHNKLGKNHCNFGINVPFRCISQSSHYILFQFFSPFLPLT